MNMHEVNTQEQETQRSIAASDMYQLLALFLHLPTEEMAIGLLNGSLAEDVLAIFKELDFSIQEIEKIGTKLINLKNNVFVKEELLTEMRREYTRLFSHPKKPAVDIYETLFLYQQEDGNEERPPLFISPAALDAERCYKKAGLRMSKKVNEPGDHMATEMEFMMYLYSQKAKALKEDNQEDITKREGEIKEFTEIHLKKWAKEFFDLCISSSQSDIYRTFSEIGSMVMIKMLVV